MNIRSVETKTGLTKRMIRHYEELGLVKPFRCENGYREYKEDHINQLLCIKALRELGFSLNDISNILANEKVEETFRRYLNELLLSQEEEFKKRQSRIKIIKRVLKSSEVSNQLLDRIVHAHKVSDRIDNTDGLEDFFKKHHVVRGHIQPIVDLSKSAKFGQYEDFSIVDITYITYGGLFDENSYPRASISICKELYAYLILFTNREKKFSTDFHKRVLSQFSNQWSKISWSLTTKLEAITEDIGSLEKLFSVFDLVVSITAENKAGERFSLAIPGQPLVVYLAQKSGNEYNTKEWLEKID